MSQISLLEEYHNYNFTPYPKKSKLAFFALIIHYLHFFDKHICPYLQLYTFYVFTKRTALPTSLNLIGKAVLLTYILQFISANILTWISQLLFYKEKKAEVLIPCFKQSSFIFE